MPIIGDGAGEDLDPELFGIVGVEFGEGAGDAGEWVHLKGIKGFDGESLVFGEGEFGGIDHGVFGAVVGVVFGHGVDLDGGILSVNLTLNEALEDFGNPDVEADLAAGGDDFKAEVFLDAAGTFQLGFVAEDAVEAGKELFGGELFLVVGAGDFQHQKNGIYVENLEAIELFVVAIGQKGQDRDDRDPDVGESNKLNDSGEHNLIIA